MLSWWKGCTTPHPSDEVGTPQYFCLGERADSVDGELGPVVGGEERVDADQPLAHGQGSLQLHTPSVEAGALEVEFFRLSRQRIGRPGQVKADLLDVVL